MLTDYWMRNHFLHELAQHATSTSRAIRDTNTSQRTGINAKKGIAHRYHALGACSYAQACLDLL